MLRNLLRSSTAFNRAERGATSVEYGLIAAVVALGILGSVTSTRQGIVNAFNAVSGQLTDVAGAPSNPGAPQTGSTCANGGFTQTDADSLAVFQFSNQDWTAVTTPEEFCAATALYPTSGGSADISAAVGKLTSLQGLYLGGTQITSLPAEIGNLTALQGLYLGSTQITSLPAEIGNLTALQSLDLDGVPITALPAEIVNLTSLQALFLGGTQITSLPTSVCGLISSGQLVGVWTDYSPLDATASYCQ